MNWILKCGVKALQVSRGLTCASCPGRSPCVRKVSIAWSRSSDTAFSRASCLCSALSVSWSLAATCENIHLWAMLVFRDQAPFCLKSRQQEQVNRHKTQCICSTQNARATLHWWGAGEGHLSGYELSHHSQNQKQPLNMFGGKAETYFYLDWPWP